MNLPEKIKNDLKESMLARDEVKTATLRMVIAAVSNARIARGEELSSEDILKIIAKEVKQREESIKMAQVAKRDDLVKRNETELATLKGYLPEQLGEDELIGIINQVITELGASTRTDMGKVMSSVMAKVGGKAAGSTVSGLVSERLTS